MTEPVLEFSRVTKRYGGQTALSEIELKVASGECLALLGHNGAGKTTAMKLALGLNRPTAGRVRVLGADPAESKARELGRMIGFLPESIIFYDCMTGREVLAFYARLKDQPVRHNEELLDRVGLLDAAGRRVRTYSKGMRQRLGLAQALLGHPRLLLLDEPTTGLDPAFRQIFYELIRDLAKAGTTVILSSHALTELEPRVDRIAILHAGRLVADGTLADLSQAAQLKSKVRITVPAGQKEALIAALNANGALAMINGQSIELRCRFDEKLALLRRICSLELPIEDVEITSPRLDELFGGLTGAGVEP